jgi:hypothetical protein
MTMIKAYTEEDSLEQYDAHPTMFYVSQQARAWLREANVQFCLWEIIIAQWLNGNRLSYSTNIIILAAIGTIFRQKTG